jgi:glutaredoxin
MNLNHLKFIILFLSFTSAFSQNYDIEVIKNELDGNTVVAVKNNSNVRKEVTLYIEASGFTAFKSPVVKLVNKGETIDFITLKPLKGKPSKYSLSYSAKANLTEEELAAKTERLQKHAGLVTDDMSKGIYIFTKDGCPRCEITLEHMINKNLSFKYYNTTNNPDKNELMWKKIKEKRASEKVTMPVVIVNGKLSHSHTDLNAFLKTLK